MSVIFLCLVALLAAAPKPESFRFVIFGDRTGEAQPGVYEQVWRQAAAADPAFAVGVGDTIEGSRDQTAEAEWQAVERIHARYSRIPVYLAPGNHDIWSDASARLFRKYAAHELHYSFDYAQAHFTVLDNSRSEQFSAAELTFLEKDLQAHAGQPVKFIISHKPSWLFDVALANPNFPLHRLVRKYGVTHVIAGHVHQLMRFDLDGVAYLSMPSSGGHLRASKRYEDGWFFGYALVQVKGNEVSLQIQELDSPHGEGRVSKVQDWGMSGLRDKR